MATTTKNYLMERLATITIGHTRVIRNIAVTRWTEHSFELGTWGNGSVTLEMAAAILMGGN